jgi:outer membrane lipase/esterase
MLVTAPSSRRGFLLAAGAASVLAACGSGTIESALIPKRFISFGDGFSDLGQNGTRYTVNDGTFNIWTAQLANSYGMGLTALSAGGTSYAQGNARITNTTDAAGKTTTLTVTKQIDKFLASDKFGLTDVVLINGGISDTIAEMAAVTSGKQTVAQMVSNVGQAGIDLAIQIQRLVTAGAKYVVVTGTYNMGKSPWALANTAQTSNISTASAKFNEQLLVNTVNLGANVLYVDAAYYFNLITNAPTAYGLLNSTSVVCNTLDTTNGLGIGTGQINSSLCNTSTIATGLDYTKYAFADQIYFTPAANILFGTYAYTRLRARW